MTWWLTWGVQALTCASACALPPPAAPVGAVRSDPEDEP
jgi:hypothetical protein